MQLSDEFHERDRQGRFSSSLIVFFVLSFPISSDRPEDDDRECLRVGGAVGRFFISVARFDLFEARASD
jgi:hypothetical protein